MAEVLLDRGVLKKLNIETKGQQLLEKDFEGLRKPGLKDVVPFDNAFIHAGSSNPETSGTGFFVFGLALGVNEGLLEPTRYVPAVRNGWSALLRAMHGDGMLGWVQPIGYEPGATTADTTEVYGVGALLLHL